MSVRVENPSPGGRTRLKQNQAQSLIDQGKAEVTIREGPHYIAIRLLTRTTEAKLLKIQSIRGYDRNVAKDLLTRKEAKHVPFAGDIDKLDLG